jgi:hypothetical protein
MFSSPGRSASHWFPKRGRTGIAVVGAVVMAASLSTSMAQAVPSSFVELDGNVVSNGTGTYDWANSGALTSPGTVNGVWTRAGSGGIFDGGVFRGNTTPPAAPPRTAAAAADTSIADAEFKIDPLSVDVTPCGTGDPTVYTGAGGETNGDLLSSDTFGTGSVPNKDDVSNVYAVAHVSGATNEVFFGAERVINNGDSHIDFEFLQSDVTIPATCAGSFSGNRTLGDFLLSVDFTNGGALGGTILYKWVCGTTTPAPGTGICNPSKAKNGPHYETTGTSAVTINVNGGGNIGCGGWVCRNPDGSPNTQILTNELMEGGIDLAQLGFTGCISTFLPHTRSSQSFTATLKDFEVIPFNTCAAPTVNTQVKKASDDSNVANGGHVAIGTTVYDTATLSGATADAGGTMNYKLYSDDTCTTLSTTPALNSTKAVTNGIALKSDNVTFSQSGTFYFQATYSGDARNNVPPGGAKSACTSEAVVVDKNSPTIGTQVKRASDDSDVANGASIPIGTAVYDTAALTGASSNAGGSVTYTLYSDDQCTTASTAPAFSSTKTVTNNVVPKSDNVTFTKAGTYYFQASYTGDANNNGPVKSSCSSEVVVVDKNSPTISTQVKKASDDSDVANGASIPIGTAVYDTSALSGATTDAGGTVTYRLFTDDTCTTASTNPVFESTKTVTGGVVPKSDNVTFTTSGTYYFRATYSGDSNNNGPVSSGCSSEVVVVAKNSPSISTQVKRASNDNDVANGGHVAIGAVLYDTATLSGATSDAGGTVTYALYTNDTCTVPSTTPALSDTVTVTNGSVPRSADVTFTVAGTFYFRATYSGDSNNNGPVSSGCSDEIVVVDKNSPAPHSTPVVQVKDTLSVTGFSNNATGSVVVGLYSSATCTTGQIGSDFTFTVAQATAGAETTFQGVTAGTYYYKIAYAGDANNNSFTSCGDETVTVGITSLP